MSGSIVTPLPSLDKQDGCVAGDQNLGKWGKVDDDWLTRDLDLGKM